MNGFSVLVSDAARKSFYELEQKDQRRIKKALSALGENPFRKRSGADIKKLEGSFNPAFYRLRAGDFRVVYAIVGNEVRVTTIMRRNAGYGWLE